jgi:hypothetical protein
MNCPKRSQMETRTPNLLLGSKETGHTSYGVTTSGCSDILGTKTKSSITRQLGTLPIRKARNSIPRRYPDL